MNVRCSYADGTAPADDEIVSASGPYHRLSGEPMTLAVHEAAHAVIAYACGWRTGKIRLVQEFHAGASGRIVASCWGQRHPRLDEGEAEPEIRDPAKVLFPAQHAPDRCWGSFLKSAVIVCAGPSAERKYRLQRGLHLGTHAAGDVKSCEYIARYVWLNAGRDGQGLIRLAWRCAQEFLERPPVWRAIEMVANEVLSEFYKQEPGGYPLPGDRFEFILPGDRVEKLIAAAGVAWPNILTEHECGPSCINPRAPGKRWTAYLQKWAAEAKEPAAAA
jgi:hypothetical protein